MPTETGRHRLHEKIKNEWGEEYAVELMSYLPPVGWADVVTKQDLEILRSDLRGEMADLRIEIERGFKEHLRWLVGMMVAMTAVFGTIVRLVG